MAEEELKLSRWIQRSRYGVLVYGEPSSRAQLVGFGLVWLGVVRPRGRGSPRPEDADGPSGLMVDLRGVPGYHT